VGVHKVNINKFPVCGGKRIYFAVPVKDFFDLIQRPGSSVLRQLADYFSKIPSRMVPGYSVKIYDINTIVCKKCISLAVILMA